MTKSWAGGDSLDVALISVPDSKVEALFGSPLKVEIEVGLGEWHGNGGWLRSGAMIELIYYREAPFRRYILHCSVLDDPAAVLVEVCHLLDLEQDQLLWVSDRASASGLRAT